MSLTASEFSRDQIVALIKRNLEKRSGRKWSVTGGRGTSWGWIKIDAPPARRTWHHVDNGKRDENGQIIWDWQDGAAKDCGSMGPDDRAELTRLLGEEVYNDGASIPAGADYRQEYLDRSAGITPTQIGKPYWD